MYEEGILKWENILTALLGIVIVASVFLVIYRRKRAKRKQLEQEARLKNSRQAINDDNEKSSTE